MSSKRQPDQLARIRINKQRSRARHQEYVTSLEARVRELEAAGVQATAEMQAAARGVAAENRRLRALLQHLGVDQAMVDKWAASDVPGSIKASWHADESTACSSAGSCLSPSSQATEPHSNECASVLGPSPPRDMPEQTSTCGGSETCSREKMPEEEPSISPCRLRSQLAANPQADLRNLPAKDEEERLQNQDGSSEPSMGAVRPGGGVACRRAYQMVIQHATSDARLEDMVEKLEGGCVKDPNAPGGCKVRNETLWEILDQTCIT